MKFRLTALMTALALCLSATACAAPSRPVDLGSADPALWAVRDSDTTIYLFGTVHVLKPGTVWFDDEIRRAFDASGELVTEIVEPDKGDMGPKVAALAMAPDGPPLSQKLDAAARAKYIAAMKSAGIPWEAFERFKPWMAAVTLSIAPLGKLGYEAELGAEKTLAAAARAQGKRIGALETPEQQLGFFNSLPEDQQIAFLNATVDGMGDAEKDFAELVDDWATGKPDKLAEKMNESLETTPELAKTLLFERNRTWAGKIKTMLARPGTVFIAVGAGHLAGRNSVQDYLKALGVKAKRVKHRE